MAKCTAEAEKAHKEHKPVYAGKQGTAQRIMEI